MNIEDKINYINSLKLDERINHLEDLVLLANDYLNFKILEDKISLNFIDCLTGMRSSRFIESDIDMILIDISLRIGSKLKSNKIILKDILNSALYYSNYYPEKYNKIELEKEIRELNNETI